MKQTFRSVLLLAICILISALWPQPVWAACGLQDPGGCVDGAVYSFWYGLAGLGWSLDRTLLLLAYQLGTFRWWLVEVAFTSAYQVLSQIISPLILPVAILAVILGCLLFLLMPLFGRSSFVNLRQALVWVVLAPALLTVSGPLIVQLEVLRSTVGSALFEGVSAIAPGAIFGASSADMQTPERLYPANPCGGSGLTRRDTGGVQLDDLAAAVLWADAEDIHCPERGGPGADIPDLFYEAAPGGPGYAVDQDVSLMDAGNDRTAAVANIQRGVTRTFLGLIPAILAVLDALTQLIFALCLVALWIGFPIGLVFVFFQATASGVTSLFRRMLTVLQVSWSSSVVLGIVTACLLAAANLRNATAYTGFAIGGIVLTSYLLSVAVDTLKGCIRTLNDTVSIATGLSVTEPVAMAQSAALAGLGAGAAVASGGAATALITAAAYQQTGSGRYAAATMLGRLRPIAQLGEVATAMGWMQDEEVSRGLYAGERSTNGSWRGTRLQLAADAKYANPTGQTFADLAHERTLARQLSRAERPTVLAEIEQVASAGERAVAYLGSANMADDVSRLGDVVPDRTRAGFDRVRSSWSSFRQDVATQSDGSNNPARQGLAALHVLDDRLRPGERGKAISLDAKQRMQYAPAPDVLPEQALLARQDEVRVPRLLRMGYTALEQPNEMVAFWKAPSDAPAASAPSRRSVQQQATMGEVSGNNLADARRQLSQAGALIGRAASLQAVDTAISDTLPASGGEALALSTPEPVLPINSAVKQDILAAPSSNNQIQQLEQEIEQLSTAQAARLALHESQGNIPQHDYQLLAQHMRIAELRALRDSLLTADPAVQQLTQQLAQQEQRHARLVRASTLTSDQIPPANPQQQSRQSRRVVSLELRRHALVDQMQQTRSRLAAAQQRVRNAPDRQPTLPPTLLGSNSEEGIQ